jgi:uncharacterized protein DUF222
VWDKRGTGLSDPVAGVPSLDDRVDDLEETNRRHDTRYARWRWNDDGSLAFSARLDPEAGAQLIAAIEGMMALQGGSAEPPSLQETPEARHADALVGLAEAAMAGGAERLAAHVPEVVVHVDVAVLSDDAGGDCLLDDGPALAPETAPVTAGLPQRCVEPSPHATAAAASPAAAPLTSVWPCRACAFSRSTP